MGVGKSRPQPSGAEGGNCRYAPIYPPLAAVLMVEGAGHRSGYGWARGGGTQERLWQGKRRRDTWVLAKVARNHRVRRAAIVAMLQFTLRWLLVLMVEGAGHVGGDGRGRGWDTWAVMAGLEAEGHVRAGKGRPQPWGAEGGNCRYAPIYPPLAAVLMVEGAGHRSGYGWARGGGTQERLWQGKRRRDTWVLAKVARNHRVRRAAIVAMLQFTLRWLLVLMVEGAGHVGGDGRGRGWDTWAVMAGLEAEGHVRAGKGRPQPWGAEGGNCRFAPIYPPLAAVLMVEGAGHRSGYGWARGWDTWAVMAGLEAAGHRSGYGRGRGWDTWAVMAGVEAAGHVRAGKGRPQPWGAEGGNCRYAPIYPPLAAVLMLEGAGHVSGYGRGRAKVLQSKLFVPQGGTQPGVPPTTRLSCAKEGARGGGHRSVGKRQRRFTPVRRKRR